MTDGEGDNQPNHLLHKALLELRLTLIDLPLYHTLCTGGTEKVTITHQDQNFLAPSFRF